MDGQISMMDAEETAEYSYNGKPLKDYFGKAAELAEDFEYDSAAAKIAELESETEANV